MSYGLYSYCLEPQNQYVAMGLQPFINKSFNRLSLESVSHLFCKPSFYPGLNCTLHPSE